jgi:hypothetical protein
MTKLRSLLIAGCLSLSVMGCGGGDDDDGTAHGGALTAPTEAKVVPLPGPALHVTWKDTATEHHFSIERKEGAGAFAEIGTALQNAMAYHDADVVSGKTYTYRIAGSKENLEKGPFSPEVSATVP